MLEKIGAHALMIIPCCASKIAGGTSAENYSDPLAGIIPEDCLRNITDARHLVRDLVKSDSRFITKAYAKNRGIVAGPDFGGQDSNGRYLPALDRYQGTLYSVPGLRQAIETSG